MNEYAQGLLINGSGRISDNIRVGSCGIGALHLFSSSGIASSGGLGKLVAVSTDYD